MGNSKSIFSYPEDEIDFLHNFEDLIAKNRRKHTIKMRDIVGRINTNSKLHCILERLQQQYPGVNIERKLYMKLRTLGTSLRTLV